MTRGAIRVEDLVKIYKTKETEVVALRGLSVEIAKGQIVCFMGPSGSGKTTLLNILGGLDEPTAGRVYVDGVDVTRMRGRELERYRLEKMGYIFQLFNLIPTLTTYENVELPLILGGKTSDEREARVGEILEQLGIRERADHFPDELSGGEKQRVAVGCALANDPSMILADEPTGELDTISAEKVMDILLELTRQYEKTVLVATHDPRVARRTELIFLMEDGRIKSEYT
ncbi:MAG: ABC transporter ATP-binding protein, partial [Candidatus Geothermarchaeales archaeon]